MVRKVCILWVFLLYGLANSPAGRAEFEQEALLFLDLQGANKLLGANDTVRSPDGIAEVDIVYSLSWNRFRFLAEYLASTKEAEMERLQFGFQVYDASHVWLGRFHVPSNYWTTAFHHGKYLQISITNPGILEFEDFGGAIPTHSTGALFDGAHVFDSGAGIKSAFSVGTAPVLDDNFLESFDVLDPSSEHNLAAHFRFSYLPDYFGGNQLGLVALYADINAENVLSRGVPVSNVELINFGAFVDWRFEDWHVFSFVTHVLSRMKLQNTVEDDSFTSGFVQAEYELDDHWTLYGRLEGSLSAGDSRYLQLIPSFIKSRQLIGARFDFWERQALTVELSNVEAVISDFGQIRIQWSAVFP